MRRIGPARISLLAAILFASALNLAAQLPTPIDTRVPPPPPREEPKPDSVTASAVPVPAPTVPVPEKVTIPSGTQFAVVLATPLSTRIAKKGQEVVFQTSDAVRLDDGLELPAETEFVGTVVEMRKPGAFGARGKIRVAVKSIRLANGNKTEVVARLDSAEAEAIGRAAADSNRAADLMDLAQWTLNGTVLGGAIHGGKGAAIGAGAGAAVALIVMMSHRGPDLYLESGTPFSVILDQPVTLSGADVFAAQQKYEQAHTRARRHDGEAAIPGKVERDPDEAVLDSDRPQLKRRPKRP